MYTFVNATCLSRSIGAQWENKEHLDDMLVYTIYQTFTKVYLILTNPDLPAPVFVDMDTLRAQYSSYNDTLKQLLIDLTDTTLTTVDSIPSTKIKYAKYSDAVRAGYKIQTTIAGLNLPDNFPDDDKHDLSMTRPVFSTNMALLHDYTLISVNGYYHMTDTNDKEAFVLKGADTMRRSNNNHIGIFNFLDIGKLEKIPLDITKIIPATTGATLRDKITFSVDQDLDNKSYILILGGYLVFPDTNVFWRSGNNSFNLDMNQLPYPQRIFESNHYLDLSSLKLSVIPNNPDHGFDIDQLYSDDVIKAYMSMSQSFLVLVDIPHISIGTIPVSHADLPGMFTSYQDPSYPLIVTYGKTAEYWKTKEDGFWSVTTQDSFLRNFIADEKPFTDQHIVTDNLLAGKPYFHSRGFLLQVAGSPST